MSQRKREERKKTVSKRKIGCIYVSVYMDICMYMYKSVPSITVMFTQFGMLYVCVLSRKKK